MSHSKLRGKRHRDQQREQLLKTEAKWLNQCVGCQTVGYKPELPQKLTAPSGEPGLHVQYIRDYFSELSIDTEGFCQQCSTWL